MFSTVLSATLQGLHVEFVQVEADISNGLPMFHLVGYLSSEVKEAGERVRTAIRNSGYLLPAKKIVVNLSPADKRKRGTSFDLPIAAAVLMAMDEISKESLENTPEPIMPSKIPQINLDVRGLMEYAKKQEGKLKIF